jgi:hypothetical protein
MLSMAPSQCCGDGRLAEREGICWSVVSNGLFLSGQANHAASIPGVACRPSIDNIPVFPAHRQKATQNSLLRHRNAADTAHCDCCLAVGDAPAKGVAFVLRGRCCVRGDEVDNAIARTPSSCLPRSQSLLPRSSRCVVCTRRIGKEATTPVRRRFREMRLTPRGSMVSLQPLLSSFSTSAIDTIDYYLWCSWTVACCRVLMGKRRVSSPLSELSRRVRQTQPRPLPSQQNMVSVAVYIFLES